MAIMEDLIRRSKAINALWNALYEYEDKTEKQFMESDELDVGDWIQHREFVQNMSDIDRQTILNLPSAEPDGIPLKWIEKHLEWLDNCDNDFAQLAKVGIRAMVDTWKHDKAGQQAMLDEERQYIEWTQASKPPKEEGDYLVSDIFFGEQTTSVGYFTKDEDGDTFWLEVNEPYAWAPLPKPAKWEGNNE